MSNVKQSPSSVRAWRGKNGLSGSGKTLKTDTEHPPKNGLAGSGKILKTDIEHPPKNGLNMSFKGKYKANTAPLQPNGLSIPIKIQRGGYLRGYGTTY